MVEFLPLLFIFGLVAGSFLNVVILRFTPGEFTFSRNSLRGRSICPNCKKKLSWYELIPLISFVVQRGRCRGCDEKISIQYPVVELLSGFIFMAVPSFFYNFYQMSGLGSGLDFNLFYIMSAVWILIFSIFILITWIDVKHYIIPNELNLSLLVLGAVIILLKYFVSSFSVPFSDSFIGHYSILFGSYESIFINHLIGAVSAGLFFGSISVLTKGRALGGGDVKLAFSAGLIFGWPDIVLVLAIAFVIGGIVGAFSMVFRSKRMKDKLPFGPFLVIGSTLTLFYGFEILEGYFSFMGV